MRELEGRVALVTAPAAASGSQWLGFWRPRGPGRRDGRSTEVAEEASKGIEVKRWPWP